MDKKKDDGLYKWMALGVVVIGTFMAILDSSIVNIAIPKMMAVFGVSLDDVKWVLTAYNLTLGAVIPLTGYLQNAFGSKKLYVFSLGAFTLGSLLCGFAWSNSSMIAFRVIQALGGGMIMPVSMSIIYEIIPPQQRGMALGFWGIASMAAPAIGPTLSGYIIENLDWRLIFNVNIPIGVVGVILAIILLKDKPGSKLGKFDYIGFLSATLSIVCVLYVLGEGAAIDWSNLKTQLLMTTGLFLFVLFVLNELNCDEPLLNLRVLKNYSFSLSIACSSVLTMALMGGVYVLPLFLQNIRGYTAMQTGMIMLPSAIATGFMMPISGKLFDKFGAKPIVIPGLVILTAFSYELAKVNLDTSKLAITTILAVRGIGMGLAMMPITTAGMNTVPIKMVPQASALQNTIRQISSAISVTIVTTLLQDNLTINYSRLS